MSYDPIEFPFQVRNDAKVVETAYLCPENLPWGATLEISPSQADIQPGQSVIFNCRLMLDESIIRPGCSNDQGFLINAWRVADDADERWGSCFYFLRPRIRTRLRVVRASWYETELYVYGALALDTDQPVQLQSFLPLRVRVRLEYEHEGKPFSEWIVLQVQAGGAFSLQRKDFKGPAGVELRIQSWFDRTDMLGSSRSDVFRCQHDMTPVVH